MTVTAPAGFTAAGVSAGLRADPSRPDLALVVNTGPLKHGAAVFTGNRAQANPIIWSRQAIVDGRVEAIVLNSGGANCFTGSEGFQTTHQTAERVGAELGVSAGDVLVCSTGLIGEQLPRERVLQGVTAAAAVLSPDGGADAAAAIMTTDTVAKTATYAGEGWSIGAMAKGAGMLAPGLATMLVVVTTDAAYEPDELDELLRSATRVSFDRLDSDGCMSTNDQVTLMASGASGITPAPEVFRAALIEVCTDLAVQLQADAEGASHLLDIEVMGAVSDDDAVDVGRTVARNNLVKTAVFGNDPNWGRILAAVGTTRAEFDPYAIDVSINGVRVCSAGEPDRPRDEVDMSPRRTHVLIDLKVGDASAVVRSNDLTHDYVHENSAYSS